MRKAGATLAAENGATVHQLKAIFGWSTLKEAARYTDKADRNRLAKSGMHRLLSEQTESKNCPPDETVQESGQESRAKSLK